MMEKSDFQKIVNQKNRQLQKILITKKKKNRKITNQHKFCLPKKLKTYTIPHGKRKSEYSIFRI